VNFFSKYTVFFFFFLIIKTPKTNTQESSCPFSCFLASQGIHEVTVIGSLSVAVEDEDHEG
jgi:hypothetical protein